mmetsp:Transcript_51803/g.146754  ORF Transcript_51803/g.146754 Transcript_51803/m.146754 type:complete len:231 (+) Transcript_51803:10-702(+)
MSLGLHARLSVRALTVGLGRVDTLPQRQVPRLSRGAQAWVTGPHCTGHCGWARGKGCGPLYVALALPTHLGAPAATIGAANVASVRAWKEPCPARGRHCSRPSAKEPPPTSTKLFWPDAVDHETWQGTSPVLAPDHCSAGAGGGGGGSGIADWRTGGHTRDVCNDGFHTGAGADAPRGSEGCGAEVATGGGGGGGGGAGRVIGERAAGSAAIADGAFEDDGCVPPGLAPN